MNCRRTLVKTRHLSLENEKSPDVLAAVSSSFMHSRESQVAGFGFSQTAGDTGDAILDGLCWSKKYEAKPWTLQSSLKWKELDGEVFINCSITLSGCANLLPQRVLDRFMH